jgi:hypothetical protein
MKLVFSIFMILGMATLSQTSYACDCSALGKDFFETVYLHNKAVQSGEWSADAALTIVSAQVKEYKQLRSGPYPTEMVLEVSSVVQGELTTREIIVEGDDGAQCRPYVTNFPIGQSYIFALNQYEGTYYISICGNYSKEVSSL